MKRVLTIAAATAVGAVLMAGLPALAGPAGEDTGGDSSGHGARLLERLDRDGDGAISREEARSLGDARFGRWDRDGDGAVTEAEMIAAAQERVARRIGKVFARMDRNGDGRLERAELEAAGEARFERMDADGDGRVTVDEIREIRARWRAGRHGKGEARPEN